MWRERGRVKARGGAGVWLQAPELCSGGRGTAGNCVGQTNRLSHQLEVPAEGFGEVMGLICSTASHALS